MNLGDLTAVSWSAASVQDLLLPLTTHLGQTLDIAMGHRDEKALVIYDSASTLATLLRSGYQGALPSATFIDFDACDPATLMTTLTAMRAGQLVVLIQSQSFRLPHYRIRVELFKQGVKVIEHANLARIAPAGIAYYVEALAYDPGYYRQVGRSLMAALDQAAHVTLVGPAQAALHFTSGFEATKPNLGDFAGLANVGSLFPIGEVFTEARELTAVNGTCWLFGFADLVGNMCFAEPGFAIVIEHGRIVAAPDAPLAFLAVLDGIRAAEGDIWVRELGFGMNRGFGRHKRVDDVGAFERMCGVHLSIGAKHGVFKKPSLRHKDARYHVDVFPVAQQVLIDDRNYFDGQNWLVAA